MRLFCDSLRLVSKLVLQLVKPMQFSCPSKFAYVDSMHSET